MSRVDKYRVEDFVIAKPDLPDPKAHDWRLAPGRIRWLSEHMIKRVAPGLLDTWSLEVCEHDKHVLGKCTYATKTISIDTNHWTHFEVIKTAIHEVAHALLPPSAGHGPQWEALNEELMKQALS